MPAKEYGDPKTYYESYYDALTCGNPNGLVAKITHWSMEKSLPTSYLSDARIKKSAENKVFLEVGAGTGVHLDFVKLPFDKYILSDISEKALLVGKEKFKRDGRNLAFKKVDAEQLDFGDNEFDRVIASCVILHLRNPERALIEWMRVTKPGGLLTIYVPSDPEPILRLARLLGTERSAKKAGFQGFDLLMAREHVNSARNIDVFIRHLFRDHNLSVFSWPFRYSPMMLRVFSVYHVIKADRN